MVAVVSAARAVAVVLARAGAGSEVAGAGQAGAGQVGARSAGAGQAGEGVGAGAGA